jgi:hypothetical protein
MISIGIARNLAAVLYSVLKKLEPLSIFSIRIENIDFFKIDSSIYGSSILRNTENIENIENADRRQHESLLYLM